MNKKKGNGKNPANRKLPQIEKRPVILIGNHSSGMNYVMEAISKYLKTRKS